MHITYKEASKYPFLETMQGVWKAARRVRPVVRRK